MWNGHKVTRALEESGSTTESEEMGQEPNAKGPDTSSGYTRACGNAGMSTKR